MTLNKLLCWLCLLALAAGCKKTPEAAFNPPPLPKLELVLGWNQKPFSVPPPTLLPAAAWDSDEFKQWRRTGDVRQLAFTEPSGARYLAGAMFRWKDKAGKTHDAITKLERFRPDGTLEARTQFTPEGEPEHWVTFAADGKTPLIKAQNRLHGLPGTPFIQSVTFYNPQGVPERMYQVLPSGVVEYEWPVDAKGDIAGPAINRAPK